MKKIIIIFLFLFISAFIFANSMDLLNLPLENAKTTAIMDLPLISGIYSFASMTEVFISFVFMFSMYACFFLLISTSFKLWAGTTEGKKAFIDVLSKVVIFIIVITLYNPITNYILYLSVNIGMTAGSGSLEISEVFVDIYSSLLNQVQTGMDIVKDDVFQQIEESGIPEISPQQFDKLLETGWTPEEITKLAEEKGYTILSQTTGLKVLNFVGKYLINVGALINGGAILNVNDYQLYNESTGKIVLRKNASMRQQKKELEKELANKDYSPEKQKLALEKVASLIEVLTGEILTEDLEDGDIEKQVIRVKDKSVTLLKNVSWNPFIEGKDKTSSLILSPSKIVKTISLLSDATAKSLEVTITEKGTVKKVKIIPEPSSIFRMILFFIYKLLMIIISIVIMVEYIITILEFFLVKSIALLLIPMLFLDATKSYAMNLLKLALSYFFKIMVTIMLCFWSLTFFLQTLQIVFLDYDANSIMTLVYLFLTGILGLFISLSGPKIASTVLSGSPSMGAGDLARGISNSIRTANHARQLGGAVAKGAAGFAQKGVKQGMGTVARFQGAKDKSQQVQAGLREARERGEYTGSDKDIATAGRQAMVSSLMGGMKQDMGDKAYKALTGNERPHLDDEGYKEDSHLKVGQKFFDPKLKMEKIATMEDVKKHAKGGKESIQKMTQKAMNKHKRSSGEELKQKLNGRRPASYEEKFPNG